MTASTPMTLADCQVQAVNRLLAAGQTDSASLDVQLLLMQVLGCSRTHLLTWPEQILNAAQLTEFNALLARRCGGEPMAHILGRREFWSLSLQVNDSTLIPRPDTERLIELSLTLPVPAAAAVLDLGTGTGAIALALKHERPHWQVQGVDANPEAVELASSNAAALGLDVSFQVSDWFSVFAPQQPRPQFDLIVSNPPYIAADDPHLSQGDVRFEPRSALVAAAAGLADIEQIIEQAPEYLNARGWLVLEHGWKQAAAVRALLSEKGYKKVSTLQDYGNVDRVTYGCWG